MFICTGNGAISFNSQNHENVLSILSSLLELHLRFCREVNLLWRTLNAVHPLPARQCEQPEPVHEIHRTQASRQWNEGHSAETTDQMLPWYTFTMVHLILSKPLWWQRERRVSAYVPMYFFFFPRLWEHLLENQKSHQPTLEFQVFLNLKIKNLCEVFCAYPNKNKTKTSNKSVLQEWRQKTVSAS